MITVIDRPVSLPHTHTHATKEKGHFLCLNSGKSWSIWRPITTQRHVKAVPIWRLLQMLLLSPVFGGCTATILHDLTYPQILCMPEKVERKRENGDIAWRRSSLERKRVKHLVTQPGSAPKAGPSHLTKADAVNEVSAGLGFKTAKSGSFEGCRPWTEIQQLSGIPVHFIQSGQRSPVCLWRVGEKDPPVLVPTPATGTTMNSSTADGLVSD